MAIAAAEKEGARPPGARDGPTEIRLGLMADVITAKPSERGEQGGAVCAWGIKVPKTCQLGHLCARMQRRTPLAKSDRMTLELRPLHGGSYTQLSLRGPVPSAPPGMGRLITTFAHWSGYPVNVVLSVDMETAGWCEVWTEVLCAVPERHLEVRFQLPPMGRSGRR